MPTIDRSIIDPFHRRLYKVLAEELDSRARGLASGGAFQVAGQQKTTAENYGQMVGYIECLTDIIKLSHNIEVEMQGGRPGED